MSTAETPKAKMIVLVSSDAQEFEVERATAVESETIKLMINDERADNIAPVPPDVHSKILEPVIQYCKTHAEAAAVHGAAAAMEYTEAFDTEFLKVDQSTLFDLILAANYLNIKSLLDLTCQTVADMMNRMTPEELRSFVSR